MKLARYIGQGQIEVRDEPKPSCPTGGLLVKTEACGLCSGELMDWYMDRKVPHVLGHEVCGKVVESQNDAFPVGSRVFPHHHAPCMECEACYRGAHVHCPTWKATRLDPGGMAEFFAVSAQNLTDTHVVDHLRSLDAALIEPLACVMKSLKAADYKPGAPALVVGLGAMGLLHALNMPGCSATDLQRSRMDWASGLGVNTVSPENAGRAETVIVCPGSPAALALALDVVLPGGTVCLFAPMPPGTHQIDMERLYFQDLRIVNSYSCGPNDTAAAIKALEDGKVRAEQVVSDFVTLENLPAAYSNMKQGNILKAMVTFE